MKNNIILFSVGVLTASVIGFYFSSKHLPTEKHSPKQERFSPDEEFLFQRSYPFAKFDINAYRKGLAEAHSLLANNRSINSANWTLEGPGNIGGRFNCIAVDPGNASVIYAGSATGGVWKTTDKGQNWAPITDALPFQAIGAIAINPNNHNEIWIGTGDVNISGFVYTGNGIYKSLDGGQSWTNIGLSNTFVISSIIFNPNKAGEVVIGTMGNPFKKDNNRGLYKTSDGGLNFTNQLFVTDSTGIVDIIQDPNNTSVLYASSFTRIRTQKVSVTAGTENYVYKSLDFGQTWTKLTNGLPNGTLTERIGLAISKSNSNILYAFYSTSNGTKPKLYKTTDAGANWNFVSFGSGFSGDSYGQQGWYFGKIYVNPADPNLVYIPAVDLFYSTDGGVNWDLRTPPWYNYEVHADGHHMQFNSPDDIIYSTDGGLYRTTDGGVTWQDIENICNNQFYAITENPHNQGLYAGGVQDNGTVSGNNSTINNFDRIYGGDGFTITYSPDPELVYAESQYGNIVYNTNFPGGTWNDLSTDQAQSYFWHTPYIISSFNPNVVYVGGDKVQRIANAPSGSFTNISPSLVNPNSTDRVKYITTINESILDKNYLFAGTADGNVWKTTDYGVNWVKINPPAGADYFITRVVPSPNTKNTL